MCLMPPKKALMAHQPPAQIQVEINHANFYTPCAYSNNFSKGVDLDLMTVQGYMKDTPRHYRHVHCTACWTHPVKPWATIARCNYTRKKSINKWRSVGLEPSPYVNQYPQSHWPLHHLCSCILYFVKLLQECFTKRNRPFFN